MNRSEDYFKLDDPVGIFTSHKLQAIKYTVEWCISDFESLSSTDKILTPTFRLGNDDEFELRIACYPEDGSFYVQFLPLEDARVRGNFKFSLLNRKGEQVHRLGFGMNKNTFRDGYGWGINDYVRFCKSFMADSSIFVNGKLIVMCEISLNVVVSMEGSYLQGLEKTYAPKVAQGQLSEDLGALLDVDLLSDVTLVAGGREVKAHKVVLSARSPVFCRMFRNEMRENTLNVVEITDLDADVLTSLLIYLYTDKVSSLDSLGEDMLGLSDKYQLDDLKARCEDALSTSLTVENVARIFILADLHRARLLKARAVDFINQHKAEVSESVGWKLAKTEHPHALVVAFL